MKAGGLVAIALFCIAEGLYAENVGGQENIPQISGEMQTKDPQTGKMVIINPPNLAYPIDNKLKNKTPQIKANEFQLTIDPAAVNRVRKGKQRYEQAITNTDVEMLIDPELRALRDVDVMSIHPQYITTITFPPQTKITQAKSSQPMVLLQAEQNVLLVQPEAGFNNGNIFVAYQSENKNYFLNLIVKGYDREEGSLKTTYQYSCDADAKLDWVDIIKQYTRINGDGALRELKRDGDCDIIILSGKTYYIIRDSVNGNANYKNQSYTVSTRYEFSNKSSRSRGNNVYPVKNIKEKRK